MVIDFLLFYFKFFIIKIYEYNIKSKNLKFNIVFKLSAFIQRRKILFLLIFFNFILIFYLFINN
jgi:hypothetical protein